MRLNRTWLKRLLMLVFIYSTLPIVVDANVVSRIIHHTVVTLVLGVWLLHTIRRHRGFPTTPLGWPLILLFGIYTVATLFAADPRVSVEALWEVGIHILMLLAIVDIMRTYQPRMVIEPLLFSSAIVIVVGLAEYVSWYFGLPFPTPHQGWFEIGGFAQPIPPVAYRLSFTMSRSTLLSAYLALLIPFGVAWLISTHSPDTRKGLTAWLLGAVIVEVLSFSRGGLLSLVVSLPILGILLVVGNNEWRGQIIARLRDWRVIAGIAVLVIVAGILVWGWASQDYSGHASGDVQRLDLWRSAWEIGLDHPLTGVGPSGYGRALRSYRDVYATTADHLSTPHNALLLVWSETGVPGMVALIVMVACVAWAAYRRWTMAEGPEKLRVAGVIAALVGFVANNMVDLFQMTPNLLPCLALLAYLVVPQETLRVSSDGQAIAAERKPLGSFVTRAGPVAALGVLVLTAIGWGISDTAYFQATQSMGLADGGDLPGALQSIEQAVRLDPDMRFYATQRAHYLGLMAAKDPSYLEQALEAASTAVADEDTYALLRANRAMLLAQSGDGQDALDEMEAAQQFEPFEPRYPLWTGALADELGRGEGAMTAYLQALDMQPEWIGSSYWKATPLRAEARETFLEQSGLGGLSVEELERLSPECWPQLAQSDGRLSAPASTFCEGEIALVLGDEPKSALKALDQAVEANPAQAASYVLRAEAQRRLGDHTAAERDARTAIFLGDSHGWYTLGQIAEAEGKPEQAIDTYKAGLPQLYRFQGWEGAIYSRRGALGFLPQLDAPGPSRRDFSSALALSELYDSQGRDSEAQAIRELIRWLDPYFEFG